MTKIATVSFTETQLPVPDGVTPAGYIAALYLGTLPVGSPLPVEVGVPFAFSISVAGTYTVEVARVDTEGNIIATPAASEPFDVPAEVLLMNVPFVVTVTLTDAMSVPSVVTVQA